MTQEFSPNSEARADQVGKVIEKFINSHEFRLHAKTLNSQKAYVQIWAFLQTIANNVEF